MSPVKDFWDKNAKILKIGDMKAANQTPFVIIMSDIVLCKMAKNQFS